MSSQPAGVSRAVKIGDVEIHVLKQESHNLQSMATTYAVESGKSISDHIIDTPNIVEIQYEMTNAIRGAEEARDAFIKFYEMQRRRGIHILYTEHAVYKNMAVISHTPVHASPFKGAYRASIRFQQMGIIGSESTVNATGGRPREVLAPDGTQVTACNYQFAGQVQPGRDYSRLSQALKNLEKQSAEARGQTANAS